MYVSFWLTMYLTDTQSVSFNQEKGFFWDLKNYEDGNFSGKAEKFHWAWKPWFSGAGSKIKDMKRNNVCWDREGSLSTECLWKIMKAWHSYCWTKGKGADQLLVRGTPQKSRLGRHISTLIPGWATNIPAKKQYVSMLRIETIYLWRKKVCYFRLCDDLVPFLQVTLINLLKCLE